MSFSTVEVVLGTLLSCIGVYYGYRRYALKSGIRFRGAYMMTSSIYCEDEYVSHVVVENVKDRSATIFAIYLRVGPNLYLTVEDFGDNPLILAGFCTFQKDYDPVEFYAVGLRRLQIGSLLKNPKVRKRLVLATSDGRYVVRKGMKHWDPIDDFFRNHLTEIAQPMRISFKGRSYGSNAIYVVEIKLDDGGEQVIPIYPRDWQSRRFRAFALTEESLESKTALETLLNSERDAGNLPVRSIEVHDCREMRDGAFENDFKDVVEAQPVSWLEYRLLGPILTCRSNRKLRKEDRERVRQRR